jgi:hypothetical protein
VNDPEMRDNINDEMPQEMVAINTLSVRTGDGLYPMMVRNSMQLIPRVWGWEDDASAVGARIKYLTEGGTNQVNRRALLKIGCS